MELKFQGKPEDLANEANIFDLMDKDDVQTIAAYCKNGYDEDVASRAEWERWNAEAIKLALQVKEGKSFPWTGCSNVKFPLLTVAALNWHAKAYPATINGDNVVKMKVYGPDPDGSKTKKAVRVGKHMSYQLLETTSWEEQTDKALLVLPIMGCVFKKTVRDNNIKQNCSDMVLPQDLVVNYATADLDSAKRVTHKFSMSPNDVRENILAGIFCDVKAKPQEDSPTPLDAAKDKAQHVTAPSEAADFSMGEQSCWLDLDGDGYKEPYAVTFDRVTGEGYRLLARYYTTDIKRVPEGRKFAGDIQRIEAENYYTKFTFIPSPDGGFYDLGFGVLLGPINESINTAFNQIFDAGTMKTLVRGFLGRGVKMRGGETSFRPGEWKPTDSTGVSLKDNIVPLPVGEPSMILLELIKFLVGYGERIAGASEIEMGQLPDNAKAGAVDTVNANGQKIFNATYKRVWRAFKNEFKKLYKLNQIFVKSDGYMDNAQYFEITAEDYTEDANGICPVADPNVISDSDRQAQAAMVAGRAQTTGGYNRYLAEKNLLEAYSVPNIDNLLPDPQGPMALPAPGPDPKMLEIEVKQKAQALKEQQFQMETQQLGVEIQMEIAESQARTQKLQAEAILILKEADSTEMDQKIALINAQIGAEKANSDRLFKQADLILKANKDGQRRVGVVDAARSNA